jgi:signal transduction histidine kinase/CheY-like chemotaxis protein
MNYNKLTPEIQGYLLIGISQTFFNLSAITQVECDDLVADIDPLGWYSIERLWKIFDLLEESNRSSPQLLFQAGCATMQSWYEHEGKELNLGSMGQLMLSDNSVALNMTFRNVNPEMWYSNVLCLDKEKGFAQVEFSCDPAYPKAYFHGAYYYEILMWGDVDWLDLKLEETDVFADHSRYLLTYNFRLKKSKELDKEIETLIENLKPGDEKAIRQELVQELAWKIKGLKQELMLEKHTNSTTTQMLGDTMAVQHKTNLDLGKAKKQAETANQAKSIFLSNMSHELRTPLNAILGFAQLMARDVSAGEEQRKQIDIISRSGKHLLSLINDILDIAKIETGRETLNTKSFDLAAFLSEISELFHSRMIDKGLFFTVKKDDDLPRYINSDEGKLRQVLINLLGNALKFTETGGVTLRVRSEAVAENIQPLLFEVEDTGIGIDPDHLEEIFDPFVQTGHVRTGIEGTGLGLAICKSSMDLLGGEISVESKPGAGSLFCVDLAVALAETAEVSSTEKARPTVSGLEPGQSACRILVVEDNAANRLLLNSLLLQVGFDTRQAENGEEAVTLFKQWQPHFIWMDMRMPVMDGYAATEKIRELPGGKEVKIVAVTAHAFTDHDEEILATGCDGLVRKPYLEHEIFDTIAQHLGVEYLFGETTEAPAPEETMPITADMLSELPAEILEELRQAALALNREAISATLERIEPQSPNIARGLRSLLDGFQIGRIRDLLDAVQ